MSKALLQSLPRRYQFPFSSIPSRSFLTLPGTPQHLTAARILPYASRDLFAIVSDIDSYSTFLPYCTSSRITKWSLPDSSTQRWPAEADLTVGWGNYSETFTSKNFCVPGSIVEALGGSATTNLSASSLQHYPSSEIHTPGPENSIFKSLSTRWTLKPFHFKPPPTQGAPQNHNTQEVAREQTEVSLVIDFEFKNPIYAALSQAVAPKVAGMMIEAFEKRAKEMLDGPKARVEGKDPLSEHFKVGA